MTYGNPIAKLCSTVKSLSGRNFPGKCYSKIDFSSCRHNAKGNREKELTVYCRRRFQDSTSSAKSANRAKKKWTGQSVKKWWLLQIKQRILLVKNVRAFIREQIDQSKVALYLILKFAHHPLQRSKRKRELRLVSQKRKSSAKWIFQSSIFRQNGYKKLL